MISFNFFEEIMRVCINHGFVEIKDGIITVTGTDEVRWTFTVPEVEGSDELEACVQNPR